MNADTTTSYPRPSAAFRLFFSAFSASSAVNTVGFPSDCTTLRFRATDTARDTRVTPCGDAHHNRARNRVMRSSSSRNAVRQFAGWRASLTLCERDGADYAFRRARQDILVSRLTPTRSL